MAKDKVLRCAMGRRAKPASGDGYDFMPVSHHRCLTPYGTWRSWHRDSRRSDTYACARFVRRALSGRVPAGRLALVEVRIRVVKLLEK